MISRRFAWVQLAAALCVMSPQTALAEDAQMLKVEEIEQAPVNCATAEGDLRVLQSERDHAENTKATSVTAITPSGVLIGILTGTESQDHCATGSGREAGRQQADGRGARGRQRADVYSRHRMPVGGAA